MFIKKSIIALLISASFPSIAISFTGSELYESASHYQLTRENPDLPPSYRSGIYMGYVKGVADLLGIQDKICTNEEINSFGDVADAVASHIIKNEWIKDAPSIIGVSNAFMELFPCKK